MLRRIVALTRAVALAMTISSCATTVPYHGQGPHPQISRGQSVPPIDGLANLLPTSWLVRAMLGSSKIDNHAISEFSELMLVEYIDAHQQEPAFRDARFRLNEYAPGDELKRLWKNKHMAWPFRLLLGLPVVLITEVILPGRIFGGDHYNPFSNTVHIYSDHPAVLLHEAGHAHDFAKRKYKGFYTLARFIPGVNLYQEFLASDSAIEHDVTTGNHYEELQATLVLYPAYATYIGGYIPYGTLPAALLGQLVGRSKVNSKHEFYQRTNPYLPSP